MAKFRCKVIGHELKPTKNGDLLIVKLKGTELGGEVKVQLLVEESERAKYPFGCAAVIDFSVQQTMPLEK